MNTLTLFPIENVNSKKVYRKLNDALGNISEWHFTNQIIDHSARVSNCACGCKIRYSHIIQNSRTKKTNAVGVICIKSIPEFTHIIEEIKSYELEKELAELREVEEKYVQFVNKVKVYADWFTTNVSKWMPYPIFLISQKGCKYSDLKTNSAKIKKLNKYLEKNIPEFEAIRRKK